MLLVTVFSIFGLCLCALEPPFPPDAVQELDRLSRLPSLISQNQLLAGLSPAQLAAYLASGKVDNTNNSLPNPIASTFPNMTTGTINGSFVVLPIDYSLARAVVPSKWGILRESIKAVLPFFPEDKFPLILATRIEHDVVTTSFTNPDFSSAQFRFPFIDLLGDGYSTFSYVPTFFVSENIAALAGARTYGEDVVESISDPPHDPYAHVPGAKDGSIYFNMNRVNSSGPPVLNTTYRPQPGRFGQVGDYPLSFYENITDQPTFGCRDDATSSCILSCINMNRFYNTEFSAGRFSPVGVAGPVSIAPAGISGVTWLPHGAKFYAKGMKVDVPFIENNYKNCSDLKGHQYLGI